MYGKIKPSSTRLCTLVPRQELAAVLQPLSGTAEPSQQGSSYTCRSCHPKRQFRCLHSTPRITCLKIGCSNDHCTNVPQHRLAGNTLLQCSTPASAEEADAAHFCELYVIAIRILMHQQRLLHAWRCNHAYLRCHAQHPCRSACTIGAANVASLPRRRQPPITILQ
jgi:hypothetical protein